MTERRASDLLGRIALDQDGRPLGRVVDLVAEDGADGPRITAAVVVRGPWGRLLGYERDEAGGPWLLEAAARLILRRDMTTVPFPSLRLRDR
jgi:hypothetical protein